VKETTDVGEQGEGIDGEPEARREAIYPNRLKVYPSSFLAGRFG